MDELALTPPPPDERIYLPGWCFGCNAEPAYGELRWFRFQTPFPSDGVSLCRGCHWMLRATGRLHGYLPEKFDDAEIVTDAPLED